ncbi:MAG: hypothetical protein AAGD92_05470 [Pseudomonadota bacterium]
MLPFVFLPFFMRALAFLVSFLSPNDEARIAIKLSLPIWTVPSLVTCILFFITALLGKSLKIDAISIIVLGVVNFVSAIAIIIADGLIFF